MKNQNLNAEVKLQNNFNRINNFVDSLFPSNNLKCEYALSSDYAWLTTEHRCPTCNRAYTNVNEVSFIEEYGLCINCDKLRTDIFIENIREDK